MDVPTLPPGATLEVDVDLGFALFFFFLLCLFLLGTMVRCAQMVLNPYSAISVSTYQEEQSLSTESSLPITVLAIAY
ncbi:cortexin domain-containing 1 protein [Alosa pseudoharengus]|uniref:cortexin domain-containing 1 protein n=1 Tax=Alosa pseudoharengus TaxID=34774 RepID=UPI003F888D15